MTGQENALSPEMQAVFAIFELHAKMQERADQMVTDPQLLPNETLLLINLTKPHRMGEIANLLHCLPSSATAVVDGLEGKELVNRHPDPADRRATLLSLTDNGQQLRSEILSEMDRIFRASSGLDTDGAVKLLSVLRGQG